MTLLLFLACGSPTTEVGRVAGVLDLREGVPEAARAHLPLEPAVYRARVPVGPADGGAVELVWSAAEVEGRAYVLDLSLEVATAAPGVEVLELAVIPPITQGPPLSAIGVVITWRTARACRSETASITGEIHATGVWTEL